MILEGNTRGGAKQMALHLLNTKDNEHIEVHEVRGFLTDDLKEALQEIHILSKATQCQKFLFSMSLNPPQDEDAPVEYFEQAIAAAEKKLGLENQPRVVVFHEKEGRRHAHCVWSRIDADSMTAINLPHYKRKLNTISKDLFLEYDWNLPQGFIDREYRNPLNMSRAEWQQVKRMNQDPRLIKQLLKRAWETSDNKAAFENALKQHGFWLARGDRRGFVAVDYNGKPYSLSRWADVKPRLLKTRLGEPKNIPSFEEVKAEIAQTMTEQLKRHINTVHSRMQKDYAHLKQAIQNLKTRHQNDRLTLKTTQEKRWQDEEQQRFSRLPRGLMGLWHRITGNYQRVRKSNEQEMAQNQTRDRAEKQALINKQLTERQKLQHHVQTIRAKHQTITLDLRQDIAKYQDMGELALQERYSQEHEQSLQF